MKRALLWAAAVLAAAVGVWLYAAEPRGLTYAALFVLCVPLFVLVIQTAARVLPGRVQWAVALSLVPLGPLAHLLWMNDQLWLAGSPTPRPLLVTLTVMPLVLLVGRRAAASG